MHTNCIEMTSILESLNFGPEFRNGKNWTLGPDFWTQVHHAITIFLLSVQRVDSKVRVCSRHCNVPETPLAF